MPKPNDILDSFLVLDYQSGNKKALALLVKRWHSKFCKQAYWYTRDTDEAKDIAQECWQQIMNKIHTLKDTNKFGSWSLAIVNRKAIDWTRKQKRKTERIKHYDKTLLVEDKNEDSKENDIKQVLKIVDELPEQQQIVLRLFYLESYSLDQISDILNISKGTVKSRLFYAREQLKKTLKHRNYD